MRDTENKPPYKISSATTYSEIIQQLKTTKHRNSLSNVFPPSTYPPEEKVLFYLEGKAISESEIGYSSDLARAIQSS